MLAHGTLRRVFDTIPLSRQSTLRRTLTFLKMRFIEDVALLIWSDLAIFDAEEEFENCLQSIVRSGCFWRLRQPELEIRVSPLECGGLRILELEVKGARPRAGIVEFFVGKHDCATPY